MAWLSLDEGDSGPTRFLTYLVAALRTIAPTIGAGAIRVLQALQPPPIELILTALLNEIIALPDTFVLVLDDYHVIDAKPVDIALTFLLEHLPPRIYLVIATREDSSLPLARLRTGGQLTELRDRLVLYARRSRQVPQRCDESAPCSRRYRRIGRPHRRLYSRPAARRNLYAGTARRHPLHRIVHWHASLCVDYLVEEALEQQPAGVQTFLLRTSILDRLCGPLCDAVLRDPAASGQATLEYLEHANLFIVPLDNERHWYRYHHLFADLLRQRLHHSWFCWPTTSPSSIG